MKAVERLKIFAQSKNLSIAKVEGLLGLGNGTIQTALKRDSPLKEDTLVKIITTFPEISPIWLLLGKGEMCDYSNLPAGGPQSISESIVEYEAKRGSSNGEHLEQLVATQTEQLKTLTNKVEELSNKIK